MKTGSVILTLLFVANGTLFAQGEPGRQKHMLGLFGAYSVPTGEFSDAAGTGYGGGLRYQIGIDKRTVFVASVSYNEWGEKSVDSAATAQVKSFQFLIGGKYYIIPAMFLSAELGLNAFEIVFSENAIVDPDFNRTTARIATPLGIGFQFVGIEAVARYFLFDTDYQNFTITVGYNLGL